MKLTELRASDVMVKDILTVKPGDKISHAHLLMIKNNIGGIPVVEEDNILVGIITQRDISLSRLAIELEPSNNVGDLMTKNPKTVSKRETLKDILEKMFKYNIERLPVIEENNRLIGLVLREPILKKVLKFLNQQEKE